MKNCLKSEKGSMAVYVIVTILSFIMILTGIYTSTASIRRNQLKTLVKIKEVYEKAFETRSQLYEETLANAKQNVKLADLVGKSALDENITVKDCYKNEITIPKDFVVVADTTTNDVTYSYAKDKNQPVVQDGIVIEHKTDKNQFVWIPIGDIRNADGIETRIELGRYNTFSTDSTPMQYAKEYKSTVATQNDLEYQKNYVMGDGYVEITETVATNHQIAQTLNDFISKAEKAHGFYIARYEASQGTSGKAESQAGKTVWSGNQQKGAAEYARKMYEGETTYTSDLINGYAWDTALIFIQKYCKDYTDYASKEGKGISSSPQKTGENGDIACNIHDMCGNYAEWSTEYYFNDTNWPTVRRGGNYSQASRVTSDRIAYCPTSYLAFIGFRPIIYCDTELTN